MKSRTSAHPRQADGRHSGFREGTRRQPALDIFVDVRHQEIAKLEDLGYSQLLYSLISTFCREYLGPSLKKWSPRFFGDGALNLELLAKRRSELWILLKDDIGVVRKGGQRQVVTRSDVQVVTVGSGQSHPSRSREGFLRAFSTSLMSRAPRDLVVSIYACRTAAFSAYGDLLPECREPWRCLGRATRLLYVASDAVSAAFQYEIRLDEVVAANVNGVVRAEGAIQLERPLQEMYGGIYFPIPASLEPFLVPQGDAEIRLELHCDWIDTRTAKHWAPKETGTS